jgi:hypothetical protein
MPRGLSSILFLTVIACTDARPVRLVGGRSDTVIVNNRGSVPLRLRLVDVNGVEHHARGVHYRLIAGDLELADDGRVTCDRRGDGTVEATLEDLSTRLTVLCRPIKGFRIVRKISIRIGDPPAPLGLDAVGMDRESVDMISGTVSVRDSQVAALIDGYVHARARGETMVDVEAGDCALSILVEVVEPRGTSDGLLPHQEYTDSFTMSAGEFRYWHLPAGRYEIALLGESGAPAHLRLASDQMNCAALRGAEQYYSCIAQKRATVIVQHVQPAGRGRPSSGSLLLHRLGAVGSEPRWSDRMVTSKCPLF